MIAVRFAASAPRLSAAAVGVVVALVGASCAPRLMTLPSGPGVPAPDAVQAFEQAVSTCRGVSTVLATAAVRGSVGGQGIRGRIDLGLAVPASARLEAIAPFGQTYFIFVARDASGTLLLPREGRVIREAPPADVLEALTGVPLDPSGLRTALLGCADGPPEGDAHSLGDNWRRLRDSQAEVFLTRRSTTAPWHIAAVVRRESGRPEWRVEYRDFENGLPRTVTLASQASDGFRLQLELSDVELNAPLADDVFALDIPSSAEPMTIDELRAGGPMGARPGSE